MLSVSIAAAAAVKIEGFKDHKNGKVEGFDKLDSTLFYAEPLDPKYYTEAYLHEIELTEEGIFVTLLIQLHNMGFSSGYADILAGVACPGKV